MKKIITTPLTHSLENTIRINKKKIDNGKMILDDKISHMPSGIITISRAMSILNRVALSRNGATLTEISNQVGMNISSVYRILITLLHERYVVYNTDSHIWTIGPQAFAVGNAFLNNRDIIDVSYPHMKSLMEDCGETVNLAIPDGNEAIFLAQVECHEMMRVFTRAGGRVHLHCSSVGKALLSAMTIEEQIEILEHADKPLFTEHSISAPKILMRQLRQAKIDGFAVDDEENSVGLRCIGSTVFNEQGRPTAAISISGPTARIPANRIIALGKAVRAAATKITSDLGGRVPD